MPKRVRIRPESITSLYEQKVAQSVRQRQMQKINSQTLGLINHINDDMRDHIGQLLRDGVAEGKSVAAIASKLLSTGLDKGVFRSARKRAWLIARTELHRARQAAAIDVYNANGIKILKWIGIADGRLCNVCASRHGKIYHIDKLNELDRIPPVHPRCRCFIDKQIPIYTIDGWRQIGDIKKGDLVLTHKGQFKKVNKAIRVPRQKVNLVTLEFDGKPNHSSSASLTVTDEHPILINNNWIEAKDVKPGDKIKLLANECEQCGKLISYRVKFCSNKCQNRHTSTNQWKDENKRKKMIKGISESNKRDYANGHRDRFKQTKKARNRTRELILEGRHNWQNEEFIIKNNQNLGKRNYGKTWGEEKFGWALKQNNIEFESQYKIEKGFDSIGRKRFYFIDFAIPKLKIAIEIDGIFHFKIENVSRDADRQRYIESLGWTFLRFKDSEAREQLGDCIEKTLRLIQNHSGEYKFMDWAVKNVRHWVPKSRKTLYNLEVEEDESYIAKGFVVHNCRLIPSDFKLDITVKKTKEGKVLETKIYPNSTDYMYVVKLDKVK